MNKFILDSKGNKININDIIEEVFKGEILEIYNNKNNPKEETTVVPMDLDYYINKIADKLGWKIDKVYNYLNNIDSILPMAALSIILREIAIELDKKYEDHINNSPEIYVISTLNGKITRVYKAHIKNYRNFAAFRTIEDAKIACKIVKPILKELFKSSGKE